MAVARLASPLYVAFTVLTYVLGAGVARYLGASIDARILALGLLSQCLNVGTMNALAAVFRPASEPIFPGETRQQRTAVRDAALYASIASLAAYGMACVGIFAAIAPTASTVICLVASPVLAVVYAVPPARFMDRGFGELLLATQVALLAPSVGFALQGQGPNLLLTACTLSLTLLLLATILGPQLQSYADDVQYRRATLMTRLGWENALRLHSVLVICTYLVLGIAVAWGFAADLFVPAFLAVPFAALQVLFLRNITLGAKPFWRLLKANANAVFVLTTYVLALGFWRR